MSSAPETYRLLVTLPNTTAEVADQFATIIENILNHTTLGTDEPMGATVEALIESTQGNCLYAFDGTDTDGSKWYQCILHDASSIGTDVQCENA